MSAQEYLDAEALMKHLRMLADEIGPRPAGHVEEMRTRQYIRTVLYALGYPEVESLPFLAPDTWGYALNSPLIAAWFSNLLPSRLWGGLAALGSAYALWHGTRIGRHPLARLARRRQSATLVVRALPTGVARHRVVLLGHTDSNKDRPFFRPGLKKLLLGLTTAALGALIGNGVAQLIEGLTAHPGAARIRKLSAGAILVSLLLGLADECGDFVPGANDNASAVACLLGLAAHLRQQPLEHTEVWFAFTGAEESGCLGAHALLDVYGADLRDAWFLDFEMVGAERVAYVTRHTGFSLLSSYRPDPDSLAWATSTAQAHPDLGITGAEMVIGEEVGALRLRGYRGICLAGVGPDGWLTNWHQASDHTANIIPTGLEKAARFAWALIQTLDGRSD